MKVTLSIVIPTHNGMPWIQECLESILNQTFTDWEVLIRDDGSNDGTREWLQGLSDPRIKVVLAGKSKYVAENWTEVSKLATGEYTKIVCQDDLLIGDCLADQIQALALDKSASMVASLHQVIDANSKVLLNSHGLSGLIGKFSGREAFKLSVSQGANNFGEPVSTMFRTDALKASLPFDPKYPYLTDLDMYRKVLEHGTFIGIGKAHAAFRVSPASWSQVLTKVQSAEFVGWIKEVVNVSPWKLNPVETLKAILLIRARAIARRMFVLLVNRKFRP